MVLAGLRSHIVLAVLSLCRMLPSAILLAARPTIPNGAMYRLVFCSGTSILHWSMYPILAYILFIAGLSRSPGTAILAITAVRL